MAQEVRDYVEAVLNSLAANVPKVSAFLIYFFYKIMNDYQFAE